MPKITNMILAGIVLVVLGILLFVIVYTMLPIQLQSQADLLCSTVSGVTLTTSQQNLIANTSNLAILILILVPVLIIVAGLIVIVFSAFKAAAGKGGG